MEDGVGVPVTRDSPNVNILGERKMNKNREIMTFTGKMFDFFKPKPETICIEDIAHHLALINRYMGATKVPYSVAEHSVRCSLLPVGGPLLNLMHDAAEAYIGDAVSPQKEGLVWVNRDIYPLGYRHVEAEILRNIGKALGLPALASWLATPKEVKRADTIMLATEVRDLMPPQAFGVFYAFGWIPKEVEPLPANICPWDWQSAEENFLMRFKELTR